MTHEPDQEPEPTQETEGGAVIPVPTRGDVFRDLEKVAKPRRRPSVDDGEGGADR